MPCIRAWLQPCRWRQSIQGFSPRCLPPCQVRETIGELLGPLDQSRLHRVRRYVFLMLDEALPTLHARLGEATLAFELPLLQHAQKLDLDGGRHVSDFIEEERALVGQFEFARLAGRG